MLGDSGVLWTIQSGFPSRPLNHAAAQIIFGMISASFTFLKQKRRIITTKASSFFVLWRSPELPFVYATEGKFIRFHLHNFEAHFKASLCASIDIMEKNRKSFFINRRTPHSQSSWKIDQHDCASKMICFRFHFSLPSWKPFSIPNGDTNWV